MVFFVSTKDDLHSLWHILRRETTECLLKALPNEAVVILKVQVFTEVPFNAHIGEKALLEIIRSRLLSIRVDVFIGPAHEPAIYLENVLVLRSTRSTIEAAATTASSLPCIK